MAIIRPLTFPQLGQKETLYAQFGGFRTITQELESRNSVWQSGNDYCSGDASVFVFEHLII